MRRSMLPGFALMLALTPSLAWAQGDAACLTQAEADGLVRFALPEVVTQLGNSCAANLPPEAYLVRAHVDLARRYTTEAASSAPIARVAIGKIAKLKPDQAAKLNDDMVRGLLGIGISEAISGKIKPKDCGMVSAVLEQLDPLPAANMAGLIGIALREGSKPKPGETDKDNPLRICDGQGGV